MLPPQKLPGRGRQLHETRRISRILELLSLVDAHPQRYGRKELAERFQVSARMIQKDLEVIRHGLKLPIQCSRQGYVLLSPPGLSPARFTFGEALALFQAVQVARCSSGADSAQLEAAVKRLESQFPQELIPLLKNLVSCEQIRRSGNTHQEISEILHRGLLLKKKVNIRYRTGYRGGEENTRTVHPYHLVPGAQSWHLIAHCESRREVRTFRVGRIVHAELLDETYAIPAHFHLQEYMGDAWGVMYGIRDEPEEVELLFESEAGRWVTEVHWHKSQQAEHLPDGSVRFRITIPVSPDFVGWVLSYGDRVRVMGPSSLAGCVAEEHRRAAAQYEI